MRQWCLTLLACYPIGSRLTLGLPALLSRPALNMRGPREQPVWGGAWTQACDLPSTEMFPISSWRNGCCEVVGPQLFTSG